MAHADSDEDWKANKRPTSTIARSFSTALDDAFVMSNTLDTLSNKISRKRQSITYQRTELEQLEAKLREMEVELQEKQAQLLPTPCDSSGGGRSIIPRRKGLEALLEPDAREDDQEDTAIATSAMRPPSEASEARPPTAPSHTSTSTSRQVVQKRRKTVDSRSRNLPSRGRP